MIILKSKRKKNAILLYKRDPLRGYKFVVGGNTNLLFLNSSYNNPFWNYELVSIPVANGTYKIKICSEDDLSNLNSGIEGQVTVAYYILPPKDVTISSLVNVITLNWAHSSDGAPDYYVIYSNNGSGNIDKTTPYTIIAGSLLTYSNTFTNGTWRFVVEAKKNSIESNTMNVVEITIPFAIPPKAGIPKTVTGLCLERISVGKVKISFLWPYGILASIFNVYHDSGTGVVDYSTPKFTFTRQTSLIQTYTTTQLHILDQNIQYKFAVRAENSDGVEETNTDEYLIEVDGVAPNNAEDLVLETIF
jgi:hypothetical protein